MSADLKRTSPNLSEVLIDIQFAAQEAAWFEDDTDGELTKISPIGGRLDFWTATKPVRREAPPYQMRGYL